MQELPEMIDKGHHRCENCTRPVCQRVLTLCGCKQKSDEEITGKPLNEYKMIDLFMG